MYSKKIVVQLLSEIFLQFGIKNVVLSPGSRNAPITIHFSNHPLFNCFSIIDERSAGFIALGMSQCTQKPTILSCTSGSASVNYYPAIVEAFYQNIPLLIVTADRPKEYIDIFDGQTIRQNKVFKQHTYASFQLSEKKNETINLKKIKQAVLISINKKGPVHINIHLYEPLYEIIENLNISINKFKNPKKKYKKLDWNSLIKIWNKSQKIMFLTGLKIYTQEIEKQLSFLQENHQEVIVLCESTSNLKNPKFIQNIDSIILNFNEKQILELAPDLLITIGQNVISKKIKLFLRNIKIKTHWHLDEYWFPNTYFCLSQKIKFPTNKFLKKLINNISIKDSNYQKKWNNLEKQRIKNHKNFIKKITYSDLKVYEILNQKIPKYYVIHFGNSSPIRYAQLFNFYKFKLICGNRGVSGIDGSTSTAVGFSIQSNNPVVMISGDLSFFYDSNALWNNYIPNTFRLIVINNSGGDIFKIISSTKFNLKMETFFTAKHQKNTQKLAEHFNFEYSNVSNTNELLNKLNSFFNSSKYPKLLEINTSSINNSQILKNYMNSMQYYL